MTKERITSLTHPHVKRWVALRQEAKKRLTEKRVLIQGKKMVEEVSRLHPLRSLIVTEACDTHPPAATSWIVTPEIMKKITGVMTPEGIAAEVDLPDASLLLTCRWILALDGVSDPGNVGTLLRTAYAFGWEGVYLLPGTCDPFNDKALRASLGAIFALQYRSGSPQDLMQLHQTSNLPLYSADLTGTSIDTLSPMLKGAILVLGSESQGLSTPIRLHSQRITIPMQPHVDSLNVAIAGGIMLYTLRVKEIMHGMG